jgi:hypothetical protein
VLLGGTLVSVGGTEAVGAGEFSRGLTNTRLQLLSNKNRTSANE